ncbi:hypothetical protein A0H81_00217 [Grifola frondosa]|uniref:Uncharacterized protein n=1 Tax=Grifola frondosa TaxID=5627 RepID=A0A1C7MUB2_GRIFR|nr:hypothetical protein A0H81_00217 [Grifola frondosa]
MLCRNTSVTLFLSFSLSAQLQSMAVLAPQDWHPPRDHTMDAPSPNAISAAVPRQRSSPANDHSASPTPSAASQQQPYPYPVQQQQAGWSPSPNNFILPSIKTPISSHTLCTGIPLKDKCLTMILQMFSSLNGLTNR